jgi:hypothetical protein
MSDQKNNVDVVRILRDITNKVNGLKAYNVKLGHGSFLTIDFGKPIEISVKTKKGIEKFTRGEWHLWVYMCAWRIDKDDRALVGSSDPREKIESVLKKIDGEELISFELKRSLDAVLVFSGKYELRMFNINTEDQDQWMIYTPDKNVLTVGPGNKCSYEPAS